MTILCLIEFRFTYLPIIIRVRNITILALNKVIQEFIYCWEIIVFSIFSLIYNIDTWMNNYKLNC